MSRLKIRKEVQKFAEEMERVLRANDHKGGWKDMSDEQIYHRIKEELQELEETSITNIFTWNAKKECVDVANFCMMLFDNLQDKFN